MTLGFMLDKQLQVVDFTLYLWSVSTFRFLVLSFRVLSNRVVKD